MAISANRLELLQIADAVAREKQIDRSIVIEAMEDAIAKAARSRYGAETDVHAQIDSKSGELRLSRHLHVVEAIENDAARSRSSTPAAATRRAGRRRDRRDAAALRLRPHRRPVRQAGDRPESARRRARAPVRRVQGPHRRDRERRREARRVRQCHRRPRQVRGGGAPRRADPARDVPPRRPHPLLSLRRAPRAAGPADLPVAHASASSWPSSSRRRCPRSTTASSRCAPSPATPGSRAKIAVISRDSAIDPVGAASACAARACRPWWASCRREDRHHPWSEDVATFIVNALQPAEVAKVVLDEEAERIEVVVPTSSSASRSAAAARTCGSPRSSPAGTSTSSPSRRERAPAEGIPEPHADLHGVAQRRRGRRPAAGFGRLPQRRGGRLCRRFGPDLDRRLRR